MKVRAMRVREPGGPEVLEMGELELPEPGPDEIRVRVVAAGVNRADLLQRQGHYPAPPGAPAEVLGLEYAGVVEARGARVREHDLGDQVMGIVAGGAMAEAVVVHAREAIRVPSGLGSVQAAAIPEVFLTAWDALFRQAQLRPGSLLLVHAATSGIGTAAIQLARLTGAQVVGTGRNATKLAELSELDLKLDASIVVSGDEKRFAAALTERMGRSADVILDGVGGSYLAENVRAIALSGTIVVIGLLGGVSGELPLGLLLRQRVTVKGSVLRARPLEEKIALARDFDLHTRAAFEKGVLRPIVADVMPMKDLAEAHRRLEANDVVGKIVMSW